MPAETRDPELDPPTWPPFPKPPRPRHARDLAALRRYLDAANKPGPADLTAEWEALAYEDRERIECFGGRCVQSGLDAGEEREAEMEEELDRARVAVETLTREAGEMAAALLNERGEGEPPSPGWRFYDLSWTFGDANRGPWAHVTTADHITDGWEWSVTRRCCDCPGHTSAEWPIVAHGRAPTARAAMRAVDAALSATLTPTEVPDAPK